MNILLIKKVKEICFENVMRKTEISIGKKLNQTRGEFKQEFKLIN